MTNPAATSDLLASAPSPDPVFVKGYGVVSPAGWGVPAFREALAKGLPVPASDIHRPGWAKSLRVRRAPANTPRPGFLNHPRLRRSSPISQFAVAAALEALGAEGTASASGNPESNPSLGVILCVMSGCVNYSQRFYAETLKDPATASPLIFPETVFNAPASHLAALLGAEGWNYTLVGDPGVFLAGLALAAQWLRDGNAATVVVVGAEELDWLTADALRRFNRRAILSEGAGAVCLTRGPAIGSRLAAVTDAHSFTASVPRVECARRARAQLPPARPREVLVDGTQNLPRLDTPELAAWQDWDQPRISPKEILGEGLAAASAWQCVAALDALRQGLFSAANVSVTGCNQQAIAARFENASLDGSPGDPPGDAVTT